MTGNSRADLPRSITTWGGLAVMVGIIIGSGIFRTPPSIAAEMGSPALILALWVVGGLISLCGALTYAELATMYPHSGGVYVFLREGFGRGMAFVFGWTYMLISKPLAAAGIAVIFASHVNHLFGTDWDDRVVTCSVLIFLTIINSFRVRVGTGVAIVLTSLKLAALLAIILLGLVFMKGDAANLASVPAPKPFLAAIVPVMAAILWTYDGWSDVGAIAGEVVEPQRTLPRIYFSGTAVIIGVYAAVNAVYMWMIPLMEMRGEDTIAPLVMERLLGPVGGTLVTLVIVISTLGSTHGSILTGARITFAQARDGLLFRFLGHIHPTFQTPIVSLWVQLALSCAAMILVRDFDKLAGGFVFSMWIFYGLAAASVFILRRRRPDHPRPYRCWGYPVVPALFILCAIGMTVLSIYESPWDTLPWVAVLLAGVPAYWIWRGATSRPERR